jgi:S-DNA-T family DNA segregation ATPase FtsK/SpoIIIE
VLRGALSRRASEFLGVALFAVALVWLIALATYDPADAVWFFNTGGQSPPANFVGQVGAFLSELSFQVFGFASYLASAVLVVLGWHCFWCRPIDAAYTKFVGLSLLFGCAASLLSLAFESLQFSGKAFNAGGSLGDWLANSLAEYLNRTGSIILILTVLFLSVILSTQFSFGRLFSNVAQSFVRVATGGGVTFLQWWTQRRKERKRQEVIQKHLDRTGASTARTEILAKSQSLTPSGSVKTRKTKSEPAGDTTIVRPSQLQTPPKPLPEPAIKSPSERHKGAFTLPPMALLDSAKEVQKFDERELMESAKLLKEKCREFSVDGSVQHIRTGPVVTTFEFKPDVGVKYSKVTGLADDLCLAMQAESVLIERLPGKSTIGIQIPNKIREQISLRDLLEDDLYRRSSSRLTLVLGKTIHGEPLVSDLAKMPHLLIAGSTGTGKSVSLNAMLTSILMRATPEEVRLILIDPKRLELGMYEGIPHLLTPVVVDPKQAANALRWAVREMEERYKQFATEGVRNILQYNRNVQVRVEERAQSGKQNLDDEPLPKVVPYIVLAIDELADLMMVASKEVEESIARLAQMARAVGIHLILATQRPSVDVITGLIKANMPSRIAFRASSKVDSRTILDANGAEQLLGKGDMLFLPPSSSRCVRVHGPYISEQETARLASFLRKQGKADYDERITADEKTADVATFQQDDLYEQAARIIVSSGQASISYLQRRLRIGFSRAARLVDMMEADGLVSTGVAGKPREVLVKPDYFDAVDQQSR